MFHVSYSGSRQKTETTLGILTENALKEMVKTGVLEFKNEKRTLKSFRDSNCKQEAAVTLGVRDFREEDGVTRNKSLKDRSHRSGTCTSEKGSCLATASTSEMLSRGPLELELKPLKKECRNLQGRDETDSEKLSSETKCCCWDEGPFLGQYC